MVTKKNKKKPQRPQKKPMSEAEIKYEPYDVLFFAGEVVQHVLDLSEQGNATEKRICKKIVTEATLAVKLRRAQRAVAKQLFGVPADV